MYREGKCIHFNGTANRVCNAGIQYKSVSHERPYGGIPCFEKNKLRTCSRFQLPTEEQVADDEAKVAEYIGMVFKTRAAIMQHIVDAGNERKNTTGTIKCPICEAGNVSFSRAGAYNGHIHAECDTAGCVSWIE